MGKSETAKLFAAEGVPVYDADAAIARLYGQGGAAVEAIAAGFSRHREGRRGGPRPPCRRRWSSDPAALARLEALVHPLVAARARAIFCEHADAPIILLDIPLLFETGAEREMDAVVVASAPEHVQRERVLARPGMTEEKFEALLARQMPRRGKACNRRIIVVITDKGLDHAREQVKMILADITGKTRADA